MSNIRSALAEPVQSLLAAPTITRHLDDACAPMPARLSAATWPMPDVAPAITTTLPFMSSFMVSKNAFATDGMGTSIGQRILAMP
jgi:hypothetical protein